jgi:membrane fusion protein (multidrug efflux system)
MPARFANRRQLCALLPLLCLLNAWAGPGRPSPAREANVVDQATAQSDAIELTGRTVPPGNVEIRPRVGGAVLSRNFKDHSEVKAGALLYQINPAPHRANVATATAAVAKAEAALASAKRKARWQQELAGIGVGEPDNTTASLIDAKSKLAAAQLALRNAQASMLATRIVAPAAGRIGASSVDVGTLVSVDGLDPLVTIQPLDPMMVELASSGAVHQLVNEGLSQQVNDGGALRVRLFLKDGTAYPIEGKLRFSSVIVEGYLEQKPLMAEFPNPHLKLLPDMDVRVTLRGGEVDQSRRAPPAAVAGRDLVVVTSKP